MTKRGATIVEKAVAQFIRALQERNASPHTIKGYAKDLAGFAEYVGPQDWRDIDHVLIRGYLSNLYEHGLSKTSVARALAALRSLYKWLAQEGEVLLQFGDRLGAGDDARDDRVGQGKLQRRGGHGDVVALADGLDFRHAVEDALRRQFGIEHGALDRAGGEDAGVVGAADDDFRVALLAFDEQ